MAKTTSSIGQLLSVNVGLPRDISWRGRVVHTGIWKEPVAGRRRVSRLNVEGDGQGDRDGHGGEQRAVFVYQIGSYRYWQDQLDRHDLVHGQFGENFTVDGLEDDQVCIGDRYRIGTAVFEVTQPRVTCYRVGIRMDHPQMASLLTSSGRPGFYFRVLQEGEVGAGDPIALISRGPQRMTVAAVNALLYSSRHAPDALERALRIPALSPGWRESFETLVKAHEAHPNARGNPALAPAAANAVPGFRSMRIVSLTPEAEDIISFALEPADGGALTRPLPGQYVVLRLRPTPGGPPLFRSYSLSGAISDARYRISVKIEPNGAAGAYLGAGVRTGDLIDVSQPRGGFTLQPGDGPVVLLSAGIGVTPTLAMLHALAAGGSSREVWWLHGARSGQAYAFGAETRRLVAGLSHGRSRVWFSHPAAADCAGKDYDAAGRPSIDALTALEIPHEADFYICGPTGFITDMSAGLAAWGVARQRIHSELFGGAPSLTPGVIAGPPRTPHAPAGLEGKGPLVSFTRSGLAVRWREEDQSLLDLAEACDVPVRWSCRSGVCHTCESGLISGSVSNQPEPLDRPADGAILICCARPREDVAIDI
ncbi:MAG: MOSC and FAD-binding oxidoreductase domain-containing protein [Caulobacteraceae bacterium]